MRGCYSGGAERKEPPRASIPNDLYRTTGTYLTIISTFVDPATVQIREFLKNRESTMSNLHGAGPGLRVHFVQNIPPDSRKILIGNNLTFGYKNN